MGIVEEVLLEMELENNGELIIERNVKGDIHLHVNNLRIQLSSDEFNELRKSIIDSQQELTKYKNDL